MTGEYKRNIILCGFMATGKSSVGKKLAALVNYEFVDMDALIEAEEGMSIPEIFTTRGEPAFRALECRMVERIAERSRCVVATGGGTIVNPKNLEVLKRCGVMITLTANERTILRRAGEGDSRPMLQGENRMERIRTLMKQREPFYAQADIILDTSSLRINQVVRRLAERLQEFGIHR
jgi:shikimate kinase